MVGLLSDFLHVLVRFVNGFTSGLTYCSMRWMAPVGNVHVGTFHTVVWYLHCSSVYAYEVTAHGWLALAVGVYRPPAGVQYVVHVMSSHTVTTVF